MVTIRQSTPDDGPRVIAIWRDAVDATHGFLTTEDRLIIDRQVSAFLPGTPLWLALDPEERTIGFMGLTGAHMDALFIDPERRRTGAGRALVQHAIAMHGSLSTDVNEQNEQAVEFYRHLGFVPVGRSPTDAEGRLYPLIHMQWRGPNTAGTGG